MSEQISGSLHGTDFDVTACLRKATSRAKSDVANKLVGMFLHDLSRQVCSKLGMNISEPAYAQRVKQVFGSSCAYCDARLQRDRVAVEHPEGMNRFRVGLHVPGNVLLACKACNREKRRDDSAPVLTLAESGWASFLSHNGSACPNTCKTCLYWKEVWRDPDTRSKRLALAQERIAEFRGLYLESLRESEAVRKRVGQEIEVLYRRCQEFASDQIRLAVEKVLGESPQR